MPHDVYVDSDWAGCPDTHRSSDAVVSIIGGAVITGSSQTQPGLPATSSGDAETRAMSRGAREAAYLQLLSRDFGLLLAKPRMFTDSSTALSSSKRLGPSTKLRHLAVAHFYVQGMVRAGDLTTHKCKGTENPANALTKHLNAKDLQEAMPWMGMENLGTAEKKELIEASKALIISGVSHDLIEKRDPAQGR